MWRLIFIGFLPLTWAFSSCSNPTPEISSMDFLQAGDSLSKKTFDTLSRTLQKNIAAGSFEKAILVCKEMAPGLTGVYNNHNTTVSRTSNRVRNEANVPDALEASQLDFFQNRLITGEPLNHKLVVDEKGTVHYFKPILVQPICLNCHGNENLDISAPVLTLLKKEYPADKATGYVAGDLRGLWHITFNPFNQEKN